MRVSVKREHYPEHEILSGHTISFLPPLVFLNLLPVDAECQISGVTYAIAAGKHLNITSVSFPYDKYPLDTIHYGGRVLSVADCGFLAFFSFFSCQI